MVQLVCPWWAGYLIDNRFRRLLHDPERIVGPYVAPGMTVLDVGFGMGFFAIPMARMVGAEGKVIAVDLQPQMLHELARRALRAGVADRIVAHNCAADQLGVTAVVDFALAFAMIHEVPDPGRLLGEIHGTLRAGGRLLIAEPRLHVGARQFQQTVTTAERVGLQLATRPRVRWSRAALFLNP
jgi:ubiquinone/menaquinone biosynthesis C-methylase UbiE